METAVAENLYQRLFALNQEAFDAGLYDVAYHALMGALHCTDYLDSDQPLSEISKRASDQLNWIDHYHPEYEHSTRSAAKRNQPVSIFTILSNQAEARQKMRKFNATLKRAKSLKTGI